MRKKILITVVIIAALIGLWFVGYYNHKSTSNLPQLSAIAEMDEADVNDLLVGYYRTQLPEVWGEPDPERSSGNTWVWVIDDNTMLSVSSNQVGEKAKIVSTSVDSAFEAKVLEIGNGCILVEPIEGCREASSANQIEVPMEHMEPSPEPQVGAMIEITHSGDILETYPARLVSVYHVSVVEPVWNLIPMVMVDGILYLDTGRKSTVVARCGMMDGEITSSVPQSQKPTIDDQSNFGTGFGYQYGAEEGTIEIYKNDAWWVFVTEGQK